MKKSTILVDSLVNPAVVELAHVVPEDHPVLGPPEEEELPGDEPDEPREGVVLLEVEAVDPEEAEEEPEEVGRPAVRADVFDKVKPLFQCSNKLPMLELSGDLEFPISSLQLCLHSHMVSTFVHIITGGRRGRGLQWFVNIVYVV